MEEQREDRPGELAETPSPEVQQDPGVPGVKFPDSEEPRQGFASNAEKDPDEWVTGEEPMTGPQASYLRTLAQEANVEFDERLTKAEASKRIEELQTQTGRGKES